MGRSRLLSLAREPRARAPSAASTWSEHPRSGGLGIVVEEGPDLGHGGAAIDPPTARGPDAVAGPHRPALVEADVRPAPHTSSAPMWPARSTSTHAAPARSRAESTRSSRAQESSRNSKAGRRPCGRTARNASRRSASAANLGGNWNRTGPRRSPRRRAPDQNRSTGSFASSMRRRWVMYRLAFTANRTRSGSRPATCRRFRPRGTGRTCCSSRPWRTGVRRRPARPFWGTSRHQTRARPIADLN